MVREYRSAEQVLGEWASRSPSWLYFKDAFIPVSYGVFATMFRMPTFIRKFSENQTLPQRQSNGPKIGEELHEGMMSTLGAATGFSAMIAYVHYASESIANDNNAPFLILAATNLLSSVYEMSRAARSSSTRTKNLEQRMPSMRVH